VIRFSWSKHFCLIEIHCHLFEACGDGVVVVPHVRRREGDFENSRKDNRNDDRTFGPKISMVDVNATVVEEQGKVTGQNSGLAALELSIEDVHCQQHCP